MKNPVITDNSALSIPLELSRLQLRWESSIEGFTLTMYPTTTHLKVR